MTPFPPPPSTTDPLSARNRSSLPISSLRRLMFFSLELPDAVGLSKRYFPLYFGAVCAVAVFSFDFLLSLPISFTHAFLNEYVGTAVFAVSWGSCSYVVCYRALQHRISESRNAFTCSNDDFEQYKDDTKVRTRSIPLTVPLIITVMFYVSVAVNTYNNRRITGLPWFSGTWVKEPDLWVKNIIIDSWVVPLVFLIAAGVSAFFKYLRVLKGIFSEFDLVDSISVARDALRPLASLGIIGGLNWTAGVIIWIAVTSRKSFDLTETAIVGGLTVIGFSLVFIPQWLIHVELNKHQGGLTKVLGRSLRDKLAESGAERSDDATAERLVDPRVREAEGALRDLRSEATWVHATLANWTMVVVAQVILPGAMLAVAVLLR